MGKVNTNLSIILEINSLQNKVILQSLNIQVGNELLCIFKKARNQGGYIEKSGDLGSSNGLPQGTQCQKTNHEVKSNYTQGERHWRTEEGGEMTRREEAIFS